MSSSSVVNGTPGRGVRGEGSPRTRGGLGGSSPRGNKAIFLPKHDWVTPAWGILSGYSAFLLKMADRLGGSKHGRTRTSRHTTRRDELRERQEHRSGAPSGPRLRLPERTPFYR